MRAIRAVLIATAISVVLALPSQAVAHRAKVHISAATSIAATSAFCRSATPKAEARLRRLERGTIGSAHAAAHARTRAQGRRLACTSRGMLKRAFVAKVRAAKASARRQKRSFATGPPSSVGQWSGPIALPGIVAIHTTLMPNGKVLFFYNNPAFGDEDSAKVMVWDPLTQTGVRRDVPSNIWCGGQVLLADGRVLVVGGNLQYEQQPASSFRGLNEIWLFDPHSETWSQGPDMRHGRWYPTATRLADGRVLITAGWDESGNGASANNRDVELYTPAADGRGPGTVQTVSQRDITYYPHQFVLPDGRVILAGSSDADTAILNTSTWAWTDIPDLRFSRAYGNSAAVLLPGPPTGSSKVMLIGGSNAGNGDVNGSTGTTEQFDATNPAAGWAFRAPLPQARRNVNALILPDGTLLAVGGNTFGSSDGYQYEPELYSPASNTWRGLAPQTQGRGYHSTAILLPDGRVLSAGDDTTPGGGWLDDVAEIYSPPYLYNGPRPVITSAPASVDYGANFTIATSQAVARAVLVAPGATTHGNDMNQRHVELAFSATADGIVATAPPSANVAPPGPYMLFLLDATGVPSIARWIDVGVGGPAAPDTSFPVVSVTSPVAGAVVSGSVGVAASASDDVGVVGVQFTVDGVNVGAEDTSAPYSVSWSSVGVSNGAHSLRAVARDAAGNVTTSAPVGVTVSNSTSTPVGLVAAYGFEEASGAAVVDSSGLGNGGTIAGSAARTASGRIGRAIDFDGVNDLVAVPDAASLDLTSGMTVEGWVQLDAVSSWRTLVLKERAGGLVYSLYGNTSGQRPQGEVTLSGGAEPSAGLAPALTAGTWTHLAVTFDGAQLRFYRNGVLVTSTAAAGSILTSTGVLRIGGNQVWGEWLDGRIDEVRVYNRALTAAQITSDMTTPVVG